MTSQRKVGFVTGSSRPNGNGHAIALRLAKMGIDVAVTGKSHFDGALALADEIKALGQRSFAVQMDVSDYNDVKAGLGKVREALGPITILINNAALLGHNISIKKTTAEEWDYEVKVCLNSAFYCIKEVWDDMCTSNWGRIINISSVAGVMGGAGQTSYGAGKAGLIALAKSAALEGARFNITANTILVGILDTDAFAELPEPVQKKVAGKTVWGRPADTEDIAGAVAYLVSDEAKYMTGAEINMLGGLDLFVF
jgi:3-oxoacyl-[acyl-carrier protein] reductase